MLTKLVTAAQNGDKQAFTELMELCAATMYKIARSFFREPMDIDDSIAETVMLCWKNLGSLKKPEYFKTWLCRILINTCITMRSSNEDHISLDSLTENEHPATQDQLDQSDDFSFLMELTDQRFRLVMILFYGEGFKISEISEMTGMPQGTVSSYLKRGRDTLAEKLRKEKLI